MENQQLSDVKGKELVAAGHAFAKAIGMDTPLIEIAKMVSVLATRLDCALVRGDEIQMQRDALAAENAALRKAHPQPFGPIMMQALDAYEKDRDQEPETGMLNAFFILRESITITSQQTDAYLNSVRADELGKVAALINLSADKKQSEGYADCARDRRDLAVHFLTMAHHLRAGKDGE